MIKVNGKKVLVERFPDGTTNVKGNANLYNDVVVITWNYENDAEYMAVSFLTKYYQSHGNKVSLFLPYVPNARMDRVEENNDIFAMKYFADMINFLGFEKVFVIDPHSNVVMATIKNCNVINTNFIFNSIVESIKSLNNNEYPIIFFPDEGAMKRYSKGINIPYAFGIKKRDWATGQILGLDVMGINHKDIEGKDVIIRDDICSKGGTFYYSAEKLKEMGAKNIYLFVSHCEKSIYNGQFGDNKTSLINVKYKHFKNSSRVINNKLINHIFTTNSIYPFKSDKNITVFDINLDYQNNSLNCCKHECDCKEDK